MESAIVTGATGFIGSNLVKELALKGVEVWAIVRNTEKGEKLFSELSNVHIIECELSNFKDLICRIKKDEIDVFYHLAWTGVSGKERINYKTQINNVEYTCDAVNVAERLGVKRFVFLGSIMEYEYKKCIENNFIKSSLGSIYGVAKMNARYIAKILSYNLNIDFIETTVSNVYGVGEISERFVNSTLRKFLLGERVSFTQGEQLYDFIYIDDAINALHLIGKSGKPFQNYYIGNQNQRPLKEFIKDMRDCVSCGLELGFGEIPYNGISLDYNEFDKSAFFKEFKIEHQTNFKDGIMKTLDWLRKKEI